MIKVSQISTSGRLRKVSDTQVKALAESIKEVGLLNPVSVVETAPGFYHLVAGMHRLEACKSIGREEIEAIVLDLDEQRRVIAECDENLCGSVMTPSERAMFTAKRKEAYIALHPETAHGGDRKSDQVANLATRSFADDQAAKTGQSARVVHRDAERGTKVCQEALEIIKGTDADTGTTLDRLKKIAPEQQVEAAKQAIAEKASPAPKKPKNGLSGLTREGLEDEVLGLREENADLRKKLQAAKAQIAEQKASINHLSSGDTGATISRLSGQIATLKYARDEAMAATKRMEYRMNKALERVKDLEEMGVMKL